MESNVMDNYLRCVGKYERISPDEEKELARRVKMGDKIARERFINANLRLVLKIAKEFKPNGEVSFADIIQNGNIGLIRAVEKFDPDMGVNFSSYAVYWIRQSIIRGFLKTNFKGSVSYRMAENCKKLFSFARDFKLKYGRLPSVDEVRKVFCYKRKFIIEVLRCINEDVTKTGFVCDNDESILSNLADHRYNPELILEKKEATSDIKKALSTITERDRNIILERFGFNSEKRTLVELGKKYSISPEGIRQIEKRIFNFLRAKFAFLSLYLSEQ